LRSLALYRPFNPAHARSRLIFPRSLLIPLITGNPVLSCHMNAPRPARSEPTQPAGSLLTLRDLCGLCGESALLRRSYRFFPLSLTQFRNSPSITSFFSAAPFHSSRLFFTLKQISLSFAHSSEKWVGIPPRSPQKRNYSSSPLANRFSLRSESFTSSTSFASSTSSPSVAANSPRCHNLPSPPARIFLPPSVARRCA
jgi:hypothetical protein